MMESKAEAGVNTVRKGGFLDVPDEGPYFLRTERCLPSPQDIYISKAQVRRFGLRKGDLVSGQVRPPKRNERYLGLLRIEEVNGLSD